MIKHPNCTTRSSEAKCDDLYCPIHGRIRDMDAGASPFVNPDEIATLKAAEMGMDEDVVREVYKEADAAGDPAGSEFSRKLRREASEADARNTIAEESVFDRHIGMENALNASFDALRDIAPDNCICDYSQDMTGFDRSIKRHGRKGCPAHRLTTYQRLLFEAKTERDLGWVTRENSPMSLKQTGLRRDAAVHGYVNSSTRPADAELQLMRMSADVVV